MNMTQQDIDVAITTEYIQSVMQANPMMALQVQNKALTRKGAEMSIALDAATSEVRRLTENGKSPKEK